ADAAGAVADEVQRAETGLIVLEERRAVVEPRRVHDAAKVDRRLPGQVVVLVGPERHPEIAAAASTSAFAAEEDDVTSGIESRRKLGCGAVERRDGHWILPRRFPIDSVCDVEIEAAQTARSVRYEVEAEAIGRQRRMLLVEHTVDRRPDVFRSGPVGEVFRCQRDQKPDT